MSTSTSLPLPLVFSLSLPSHLPITLSVLLARMVVDPPEDQVLLLLNALEFAIDKGNLVDTRNQIRALCKLRWLEKGTQGCEDVERSGIRSFNRSSSLLVRHRTQVSESSLLVFVVSPIVVQY
jgi:hypothetical protein